jgi:cytochrome b subunit of formate dehydrogenase
MFFFLSSSRSFDLRGELHRFSAIGLIGLSLYHLYYILFTERGRENFRHILPGRRDLRDFLETLKCNLGRRKELPEYPKFDVFEKLEYVGAFWGNFIMILTGALLWRKDWTLAFAPLWFFDVVRVVHRYEAILALAFVAIWHMYCVHLKAGQFPLGKVFLHGKISLEEMKHRHRGWYKQYVRRQIGGEAPPRK